jgi:hypothetical protein
MKRLAAIVLVVLAAVLVVLVATSGSNPPAPSRTEAEIAAVRTPAVRRSARAAPEPTRGHPPAKRKIDAAQREHLREKIAEALRRRQARAAEDGGDARAAAIAEPDPTAGKPGEIRDRSGGALSTFMGSINEDFMPLADECHTMATERGVQIEGMLDIEVAVIADEEEGGLVDSVDLGEGNEVEDVEFTQCVQESLLSTYFETPGESGAAEFRLTLRFE